MVPRRGNNLAQTLACRAYKQALPRRIRYQFRNFFRNPCEAGYQNSLNKQGRHHNKGGGVWMALEIVIVAAQILNRPDLLISCEKAMVNTTLRFASPLERS